MERMEVSVIFTDILSIFCGTVLGIGIGNVSGTVSNIARNGKNAMHSSRLFDRFVML